MSSAILNALDFVQPTNQDVDIEMSDRENTRESQNNNLVEIQVKASHQLFTQLKSDAYSKRAHVINSFLSLIEISPARASTLIHEAAQDSSSQQFRDYILFKQIFSDMTRCRETRHMETITRKSRTSSSNQQSVIGPNIQLDSLQWMFSFFTMHSIPFHHKSMDDGENTIIYLRQPTIENSLGPLTGVVLVQSPEKQTADSILSILNEFNSTQTNTRIGIIINGSLMSILAIDNDVTVVEPGTTKSSRTVEIAQKSFDMTDIADFAEIVTCLEGYLTTIGIETVIKQITNQSDEIQVDEDDMESSPVPKTYTSFEEQDTFYVDRFQTSLSNLYFTSPFGPTQTPQFCVKKRSHFCDWERDILQKLKNHPYIIRELECSGGTLDLSSTMLLEPVRPLNKRLFSLLPTDAQGTPVFLTQQLLNTRFEILRQFIKQALHSVVYCHNNGIIHNNILSRGATFLLDEQYKLKLMGFEHAIVSNDPELLFRDMRHLAVFFAELIFNVEFDVQGDDDLTDWSAVWQDIEHQMEIYQDIVEECSHITPNDRMLYQVNRRTKKHMFDLLEQMFHTNHSEYYHTFMYHSYVGMASSAYKEKSKQKLREKTVQMLHQNKVVTGCTKREIVAHKELQEKWMNRRVVCK